MKIKGERRNNDNSPTINEDEIRCFNDLSLFIYFEKETCENVCI